MEAFARALAPVLVRFRWAIIVFWIGAIALGASRVGTLDRLIVEDTGATQAGSYRANEELRDVFDLNARTDLGLIFERAATLSPEAFGAYEARVVAAVKTQGAIEGVEPITLQDAPKTLALEHIRLKPGLDDPTSGRVAEAIKARLKALPAPDGMRVRLMGRPVVIEELNALNNKEVRRIEQISLLISLVILILVFGSLVAAFLPVLMGVASILVTLGVLVGLHGAIPVVAMTRLVTSVIALGLGIDYALFIVSRFREERRANQGVEAAIATALRFTGEAILFSGLIMIIAVAALAIPDVSSTRAIAGAVVIVVATSLLTSFTLLPALLAVSDRVLDAPKAFARLRWGHDEAFWGRFARGVIARYKSILLLAALGVALLVVQIGHIRFWEPGPTLLPETMESRQAYDTLVRAGLAGELDAFYLVAHQAQGSHVLAPETVRSLVEAARQIAADPRVRRVDSPLTNHPGWSAAQYENFYAQLDNPLLRLVALPRMQQVIRISHGDTYVLMRIVPRKGLSSPETPELIHDLNHTLLPAIARPAGLDWALGGDAPRRVDFSEEMYSKLPAVAATVVGAIALLLTIYFRSLVLPIKAVLMNLIPVLGACGVLVLVLQDGVGARWIGVSTPPGALMAMTPLMVFCLIFGLGMDYEVLILSRIQEAHRRGLPDAEAIVEGMTRTSGAITGAALIMLSVFAPNLFSQLINAKELGLSLTAAVVLDATVVRLLLVPTLMRAMGRWNWWFPFRRAEAAEHSEAA